MELTSEQLRERTFKKTKAFVEEYEALCKKHGMQHQPFLQNNPQGIIPVCLPVEVKE